MDDPPASSSSSRKRSFIADEDDYTQPLAKRVRFPKGKKVKATETPSFEPVKEDVEVAPPPDLSDPRTAAKDER